MFFICGSFGYAVLVVVFACRGVYLPCDFRLCGFYDWFAPYFMCLSLREVFVWFV